MEGSNKKGKYAMFSTFTFNQHINIFMIKIVWGIISRSNNPDSIAHYISMILAFTLGTKISYTDEYLPSESEIHVSDIFDYVRFFYFFSSFMRWRYIYLRQIN